MAKIGQLSSEQQTATCDLVCAMCLTLSCSQHAQPKCIRNGLSNFNVSNEYHEYTGTW